MIEKKRREALLELADKKAHADYLFNKVMAKPIPKRKVTRAAIHKQAEQAQLRDAFRMFGF